uniref:Uncharacterized protein n=1 Tax=Haptolina ericina TaxID=156174 RepID=A0A7S3EWT8_9EUKA|mmetsp:Transcript_31531/g.71234  ORF Transcript_31531/g.71234 Transcript_31531/m.71234 type:complete len:116 (+) Transcript_31531:3-350(+)
MVAALSQPGGAAFSKVEKLSDNASKKVGMLQSIAHHRGHQLPLADPLVVASLVDDSAALVSFERKCRAGHDASGKPTFQSLSSSSVAVLMAQSVEERARLYLAVLEVLAAALVER